MNFDTFVKDCKSYADFAQKMKEQESKEKGDYSEEYFLRFFKWAPFVTDVKGIYNTNDPASKFLVHKYPELQPLGVGTPNSPVVDLIIEHTAGYSLVSAKWYTHGLQLNDIAALYGIDADKGYPNLKFKYLATNAPRTSQVVQQVFKHNHPVIKVLEDEFDLDYIGEEFNTIIKQEKPKLFDLKKWHWRNKREQLSFIKFAQRLKKEFKAKVQLPPGWGKTYLMWRLDKYFWSLFGGQTICMADGVIVLKQNFDLYNKQYKVRGIERPSIVICSGAADADMVDWPVEVVGRDPVKVARWLQKNPDGIVFCFYGNAGTLDEAVRLNKQKDKHKDFTFAACDEASRTCSEIGSGWSHIVHDHLIPVKYRAFLDATHRHHKTIGMNVKSLYGEMADHVSQVDSEKWGSTTGFFIQGMVFNSKTIQQLFHKREFIKGKKYTVDDKCTAVALLEEFVNDPTMEHNLTFGHAIKNLKNFAEALEDARTELLKQYKSLKYQKLKNIKIYVADTHIKTSRDIREELKTLYENEERSIVLTSRLLYRGWSQVKLDSVLFMDNFNSVSYTVQALGRGLRKNEDRPDKLCKVLVPVDLNIPSPWNHLLALLDNIKNSGDSRPVEDIIGQVNKPRSKAKRKPQSGSVILPVSGHIISAVDIKNSLKTAIVDGTNWMEWSIWFDLAREMFKKAESNKHLIPAIGGRNYAARIVYDELVRNDRYKTVINDEYKANKVTKEEKYRWLWRKVVKLGFKKIKLTDDWKSFKMDILDAIEDNDQARRVLAYEFCDKMFELRKSYWMMESGSNNKNINKKEYNKDLLKIVEDAKTRVGVYYPDRNNWQSWLGKLTYGTDLIEQSYVDQKNKETKEYIEQRRHNWANEVYERVFVLHAQNGVPMPIMRRHIEDMLLGEPNKFERWIHSGQYGKQEYNKKFKDYIEYPVLREGQPRCSCCNKQGGEGWTRYKNYGKSTQEKYHGFYDVCAPCKKELKKKETA